jgi:hypothetical protein
VDCPTVADFLSRQLPCLDQLAQAGRGDASNHGGFVQVKNVFDPSHLRYLLQIVARGERVDLRWRRDRGIFP